MNFCPVQSDLDRMYFRADMAEAKYKRIRAFLKGTGRVEEAIIESIREDASDFEWFLENKVDRQLVTVLAVNVAYPPIDYDPDYLRGIVRGMVDDFVKDQYEEFEEKMIDREWNNWSDE
jgi:hypothetical protein